MTDLRKAAEMALDALEKGTTGLAIRAIPALRQALAQEQIKCPRCGEVNPAEIHTCSPQVAQPEQEELIQFKDGKWSYVRKPWVGLTREEVDAIREDIFKKYQMALSTSKDITSKNNYSAFNFYRAIEAKLKEKNG